MGAAFAVLIYIIGGILLVGVVIVIFGPIFALLWMIHPAVAIIIGALAVMAVLGALT